MTNLYVGHLTHPISFVEEPSTLVINPDLIDPARLVEALRLVWAERHPELVEVNPRRNLWWPILMILDTSKFPTSTRTTEGWAEGRTRILGGGASSLAVASDIVELSGVVHELLGHGERPYVRPHASIPGWYEGDVVVLAWNHAYGKYSLA